MWLSPSLRVKWGPYFDLDTSEKMATVAFAQAALGGVPEPLITKRQAVAAKALLEVWGKRDEYPAMLEFYKKSGAITANAGPVNG